MSEFRAKSPTMTSIGSNAIETPSADARTTSKRDIEAEEDERVREALPTSLEDELLSWTSSDGSSVSDGESMSNGELSGSSEDRSLDDEDRELVQDIFAAKKKEGEGEETGEAVECICESNKLWSLVVYT